MNTTTPLRSASLECNGFKALLSPRVKSGLSLPELHGQTNAQLHSESAQYCPSSDSKANHAVGSSGLDGQLAAI